MIRASWARIAKVGVGVPSLCLLVPALASAQGGPGFLFKQPTVTLKFETGYGIQRTGSDIFEFTREKYTVGSRDFDAPYVGGEVAVRVNERWDVALGVGVVQNSVSSEYRLWVDQDSLPIEQVTEFRTLPITLSAKYYFSDRGRRIGRFAWVPNTLTPYVGAGVGVVSYRFEQSGDFIDFDTPDNAIFYDQLTSSGEAALLRGLAGVTLSLGKQFELTGEARYDLASADLSERFFNGFEPIDLSGFRAVVGIALRF